MRAHDDRGELTGAAQSFYLRSPSKERQFGVFQSLRESIGPCYEGTASGKKASNSFSNAGHISAIRTDPPEHGVDGLWLRTEFT
mmetsp:Transcript_5381/g.12665  ORF Transcript_5381/g.12665 Transcript_5381/m.12665 type:complete len:84 (-) Transcript_5381:20-271(-)